MPRHEKALVLIENFSFNKDEKSNYPFCMDGFKCLQKDDDMGRIDSENPSRYGIKRWVSLRAKC